ncbi:hypothetical protein JVT61DRAFT_8932 [Boletus reticuloceps]|uniref:Wax synthase domain-containing protein n=1 Tax=Boletus reticuloceps TaxID=495285 RepID=A0A8I2YIG6_9AGAM|nr:hypothetical protein JVT61DRAFT_8932 [Boletus reticuloceps]
MSFASFAVLSLRNALGVPSPKVPIDGTAFVLYVLPAFVCQFAVAVLAVKPQTHTLRVVLWPLVALLAARAALSVDMSLGKIEQKFNNTNFVLFMISVAARTLDWALAKRPLVRHLRPTNSSPSTIMDAIDLVSNFRGHGWDWSRYRSYIPRETRPANCMAFVLYASLSAVAHALICGAFHRAILTLVPTRAGPITEGSTIFDDTLPFPVQYLRATMISALFAIDIYATMQMSYDLCTVLGILVLGQDPVQWPPAFNAPWRATSLSSLWGCRWHQFLRHTFLILGGYPLSVVLGRAGLIIGAFLASVLWHHTSLITLDSQVEMWWMLVGFGMMGPGILAERVFYQLTGRRVGGVLGWVWTMVSLMLWGNMIVEGFARAGMFGCSSPLDSESPLRASVERLVMDFDVWLHALN